MQRLLTAMSTVSHRLLPSPRCRGNSMAVSATAAALRWRIHTLHPPPSLYRRRSSCSCGGSAGLISAATPTTAGGSSAPSPAPSPLSHPRKLLSVSLPAELRLSYPSYSAGDSPLPSPPSLSSSSIRCLSTTSTTNSTTIGLEDSRDTGNSCDPRTIGADGLADEPSSSLESRLLQVDSCLEQVRKALEQMPEEAAGALAAVQGDNEESDHDDVDVDDDEVKNPSHWIPLFREAVKQASWAHDILDSAVPELSHRRLALSKNGSGSDVRPEAAGVHVNVHVQVAEVLPRCCQLLDAWSKLARAGNDWRTIARNIQNRTEHPNPRVRRADNRLPADLRGVPAPQRAQYLLDRMESTPGLSPPPTQAYHSVMECWAYSQEHRRATMAEGIFQRLHGNSTSSSAGTSGRQRRRTPSVESHRIMVHAWGLSTRDPRAAFHATGHLMRMVKLAQQRLQYPRGDMEGGDPNDDEDLEQSGNEPTLDDFRVVMEAWTRAEDKTSPNKAHSALKLMENAYEQGWTRARPDLNCYRAVLQTAARRPTLPDLDALVDSVLTSMRHQLISPDTACYEAAAEAFKNAALLYGGSREGFARSKRPSAPRTGAQHRSAVVPTIPDAKMRDRSASRALDLLDEIQVSQQQQGERHARLSTRTINHVLEALSASQLPQRTDRAVELLSKLEEDAVGPRPCLPDLETYRLVMEVWKGVGTGSASEGEAKVAGAEAVLDRLQLRCSDLVYRQQELYGASGRQVRNDLVAVYNAFVGVCGSVPAASEESGMDVFRRALTRLQGLRALGVNASSSGDQQRPLSLSPNAESYAGLLEACTRLLPNGKDRQRWVERVFRLACEEGMVDERVLHQLKLAATEEQYSRLVVSASEASEGSKLVPEAWTRNALRGRVVTSEGRRTMPLTVQGRLTVTPAMQEFRMRRLRDHRNRTLLQGGRVRLGSSIRTDGSS